MLVTIHQPNFLPWLGFFDKMADADLLVVLDHVGFEKGGYQNRVRVKGPSGEQWLTAPVNTAGRCGAPIHEVELNHRTPWGRNHRLTLRQFYGKTPGYAAQEELLETLYGGRPERLVDFTVPALGHLAGALGVSTPVVLASSLGVGGRRSELLCALVREVGGTAYLSGPSGRDYLDEEVFRRHGIEVHYHSFRPFAYPQPFGPFAPAMSTLDYLFNDPSREAWTSHRAGRQATGGARVTPELSA
ncbi:WbqC family protein [Deinococcus planocerae]|uniref:WbqC family protein n=1 Tax=Deinococcus planocerae TaxID=1737569 RepID=UPI000C7E9BDD|nr:WbqC family protein [Deinococcus planocerae]